MFTVISDKRPILYRYFDRYLRADERKGATPGKYPHYYKEELHIIIDGKHAVISGFSSSQGSKFCQKNFGIKPKCVSIDHIDDDELYK